MTNKSESQRKRSKQIASTPQFHQRFNVKMEDQQAKEQFLNRVENLIVLNFFKVKTKIAPEVYKTRILWQVANELGKKYYSIFDFENYVQGDFYACLKALGILLIA